MIARRGVCLLIGRHPIGSEVGVDRNQSMGRITEGDR